MQHVDRIFEFGDIDHTKRASLILNSDFLHARTDGLYWLPVVRLLAVLHLVDLISGFTAYREGNVAQIVQSAAEELNRFGLFVHE